MVLIRNLIKYIFDFFIALILFIPAVFFSIVVGIVIKLDSPGPIFFKQERYGKNNKPFIMYKFRTMVADASSKQSELQTKNEASGFLFKIAIDPRQTRVGKKLRDYGLDEFPQIFNILKGEMSLVGPRPLPVSDVDFSVLDKKPNLKKQWDIRKLARPGITGLWQINPGDHSFEDMLMQDEKYIKNPSLYVDIEIIKKTAQIALSGIFPKLINNPKKFPREINKKIEVINKE